MGFILTLKGDEMNKARQTAYPTKDIENHAPTFKANEKSRRMEE
jgi:hypothetical protein